LEEFPYGGETMKLKIYLNTDNDGNILLPFLMGTGAMPDTEYKYYFEVSQNMVNVEEFPSKYKVINGELAYSDKL